MTNPAGRTARLREKLPGKPDAPAPVEPVDDEAPATATTVPCPGTGARCDPGPARPRKPKGKQPTFRPPLSFVGDAGASLGMAVMRETDRSSDTDGDRHGAFVDAAIKHGWIRPQR